jgi:hypothetical protein
VSMKRMQDKSKLYNTQEKGPTPNQTKPDHKLPLKPINVDDKHQVLNSRG